MAPSTLIEALGRARDLGFLGPGPLEPHIAHAGAFAVAAGDPPERFLDLGSGAGVPGLVLALTWPDATAVLLDATARKCEFLEEAAQGLGLSDRVRVVMERAEVAGRSPELRGTFSLVTARGFAAPPVTAECGAPFLGVSGTLLVSDPPGAPEGRWPAEGLAELGLEKAGVHLGDNAHIRRLRATRPCPDRFPRPVGQPARQPLFSPAPD